MTEQLINLLNKNNATVSNIMALPLTNQKQSSKIFIIKFYNLILTLSLNTTFAKIFTTLQNTPNYH